MSTKSVKRISGVPHTRLEQHHAKPKPRPKPKFHAKPRPKVKTTVAPPIEFTPFVAPNLNIATGVVATNVVALDIYSVPIKQSLVGVKRTPGSIVLNQQDHGFYGFNGKIWTPFRTPPTGLKTVLSLDDNAAGQSIVNVGNLQGATMNLEELDAVTMNVSSLSLGGDLDLGGNDIVAANGVTANVITATLYTGNINSFERITGPGQTIALNIVNTLLDINLINFNWITRIGGTGNQAVKSISMNNDGQVSFAGNFDNTICNIYQKDGITINYTIPNNGVLNNFIVKYTNQGVVDWYAKVGGNNVQVASTCTGDFYSVYSSGEIYFKTTIAACLFSTGYADLYNVNNTSSTIISVDADYVQRCVIPVYVELYGSSPTNNRLSLFLGSVRTYFPYYKYATIDLVKTTMDGNNNVYVLFKMSNSSGSNDFLDEQLVYGPDAGSFSISLVNVYTSEMTICVAKFLTYDTTTSFYYKWARRLTSTNFDNCVINTNTNGTNIVLAGNFSPILYIYDKASSTSDSIIYTINNIGGTSDIFLINNDDDTNLLNLKSVIGGPLTTCSSAAVAVNNSGDVVLIGNYTGTLNIYNVNSSSYIFTLSSSSVLGDAFIIKYDNSGNLNWATRLSATQQSVKAVSINNDGEIVVTGEFNSPVLDIYSPFGTNIVSTLGNTGGDDIYIIKYDLNGDFKIATKIAPISPIPSEKSVNINKNGDFVVAGNYTNTILNVYNSNNTITATMPFDSGTNSFLVNYNTTFMLGVNYEYIDGQNKTITNSGSTCFIEPNAKINGLSRQNIKLLNNQYISMLWDGNEGNWIIKDNTGTFVSF